jgi:hypothetical protein
VRTSPGGACPLQLPGHDTTRAQHAQLRGRVGLDREADQVLGQPTRLGPVVLGPPVPPDQPAPEQQARQRCRQEPEQPRVRADGHGQGHDRHGQVADGIDHAVVGAAEGALPLAHDLRLVAERR